MKQGNREKLSVTVSPRLYEVVERYAERAKVTKSKVVEEAIRLWERSRQAAVAREGTRIFPSWTRSGRSRWSAPQRFVVGMSCSFLFPT